MVDLALPDEVKVASHGFAAEVGAVVVGLATMLEPISPVFIRSSRNLITAYATVGGSDSAVSKQKLTREVLCSH